MGRSNQYTFVSALDFGVTSSIFWQYKFLLLEVIQLLLIGATTANVVKKGSIWRMLVLQLLH